MLGERPRGGAGLSGVIRNGKIQHSSRGTIDFTWINPDCTTHWDVVFGPWDFWTTDPKDLVNDCG